MPLPTTNLILHLDAGAFGGADNDPIGTLADQSGNSNDATASGGARPTFKTGIVNGYPVVRFDGSNHGMGTPATGSASDYTGLAVLKPSGTSNYRPIIGSNVSGGILWRLEDSTNQQLIVKDFVANVGSASSTGVSTSDFSVVAFTFSEAASYALYLNGTADGSGSHSEILTIGRDIQFGYSATNGNKFAGDIAELAVYDAVLGSTDLDDATDYLGVKYAIPGFGGPPGTPYDHKPQRAYRNIAAQQNSRR